MVSEIKAASHSFSEEAVSMDVIGSHYNRTYCNHTHKKENFVFNIYDASLSHLNDTLLTLKKCVCVFSPLYKSLRGEKSLC